MNIFFVLNNSTIPVIIVSIDENETALRAIRSLEKEFKMKNSTLMNMLQRRG